MKKRSTRKSNEQTRNRGQMSQRSAKSSSARTSGGELSTLHDLLVDELRDLYDAENQLIKALPKVAAAISSSELRDAIQEHLQQTRGHVDRLERVFDELDESPRGTHCDGMEGLLKEGKKMMEKKGEEAVIDAGIISAAQRVEHYEIAGYGCVVSFAKRLGHSEAAKLLAEILEEEKAADEKLTEIAESTINAEADQEAAA
jgi:ferritin-like metal-binding protein YciE